MLLFGIPPAYSILATHGLTGQLVSDNRSHPLGTFLYTASCMHCMTVSLAQGEEGLGAMWGEEKTRESLTKAGFRSVQTNELAHDIQNNWYVVKKGKREHPL